jgi:hypothetical protein
MSVPNLFRSSLFLLIGVVFGVLCLFKSLDLFQLLQNTPNQDNTLRMPELIEVRNNWIEAPIEAPITV